MEPITFNKSGLLYYFLTTYAPTRFDRCDDHTTCSIMKYCFHATLLVITIILGVGATIGLTILQTTIWLVVMAMNNVFIEPTVEIVVTCVIAGLITMSYLYTVIRNYSDKREYLKMHDKVELGPVGKMIDAWKNKYCTPIVFKE